MSASQRAPAQGAVWLMEALVDGALTAVLLNPPLAAGGTITERNVTVAGAVLGAAQVRIVNLIAVATRDLPALSSAGASERPWREARPVIAEALVSADAVLFAWGLGGLKGDARLWFRQQAAWVVGHAAAVGHTHAWMLDGAPRHPSRWRQYVGPQRGRVTGADFEDRLRTGLSRVSLHGGA